MFKQASIFAARLTEIEKMRLRSAEGDRLKYLFHASHRFEIDLPDPEAWEMMKEAQVLVIAQFRDNGAEMRFGSYWKF